MSGDELRDFDDARMFLLQGLCLQRVLPATTLKPALEWALAIVSGGSLLPPVCLVADLGNVAFGRDLEQRGNREAPGVPGVPAELLRMYEDHVLGKVYADWTFSRAGDALRRYPEDRRGRGLAFVLEQFRQRAGFAGAELSPAWVRTLMESQPDPALAAARQQLHDHGLHPLLARLLDALLAAARRTAEVLGPEDVFELEHGTALDELSQRLALRQVLQAAHRFEERLPHHRLRPLAGRHEVPTHVLDEDTYPVGGYSSLSTRGSIESLLHSQLAYMEKDSRPDLFDLKYLRDELLYYARDENQFLRRRRHFAFVLFPDLVHTRFKDAALPYQRVVLLWALLLVAVQKLCEWLSTDALQFVFYFVAGHEPPAPAALGEPPLPIPLEDEYRLLAILLREQIANKTVRLARSVTVPDVVKECTLAARRSLCQCLTVSAADVALQPDDTVVTRLRVAGAAPALGDADRPPTQTPEETWQLALELLLRRWI
jgi:vWA domain found in the FtsH ternary systems/N-terminal helical region fused to the FtsH ternary system vWA domain